MKKVKIFTTGIADQQIAKFSINCELPEDRDLF